MSTLPAPATAPLADGPPAPGHGWTPALKARFLDRLAAHGNARAACRNVGLSAEAAYKLRRRDPLFARGWAAALLLARDNGAQVLAERAIEGVEEPIYYRGELIGTRRRYDNRLLLAHLARLDRLADEAAAGEDAGRFDEVLAAIADGASPLPERDAFIEAEIEAAQERHRRDALDAYYDAADAAETARAAAADGIADFDEDDEVEEASPRRARDRARQRRRDRRPAPQLDRRSRDRRGDRHRRHRPHRPRRDARSARPGEGSRRREGHPRLRRAVPLAQLPDHRHEHDPEPRLRGARARNLRLRPPRLERRGEGRVGHDPRRTTRQPQPSLQLRRPDAEAEREVGFFTQRRGGAKM